MNAQPKPKSAQAQGPEHVLVVFPGYYRQWATWIYQTLESRGHSVNMQRWDPPRDEPLERGLGDLLLSEGRVLLVLNEWFFELGPRPEGEWDGALRGFVAENRHRFAAVHLTDQPLPAATSVLRPAELYGIGEDEAVHRLLERLELPPGRPRPRPGALRFPGDPPPVWGAVPRRNHQFTGRDDLLNTLQHRLSDAVRDTAACAIVGMPGIGKTELAAEYAYRFRPQYDVVWWVPADTRSSLRERYSELAPRLGITAETGGPGERIRALRETLRTGEPYRRWLVVFDGWDDVEGAEQILPQGEGHVLITSRYRSWSQLVDQIEVPGFQRAESTGFLMRRASHLTAEEADRVSVEFEDLPLALVQAAALLGESGMPADEYLSMVRERPYHAMPHPDTPSEYPQSSLTSWSILINRLRREQPRTVELLALCSAFAPGRIPLGLVRQVPEAELPEQLRWIARDGSGWARAIDTLVNFCVLRRDVDERQNLSDDDRGGETVRMHRVVHSIISRLTADDNRDEYRRAVRRALARADPGNALDSRSWPRYAEIRAHLEPSGALDSRNPRVRETVVNCLRYCLRSGEYISGGQLADRVRRHWTGVVPGDDRLWMQLTSQQGAILRESGDFHRAYELDQALFEDLQSAAPVDEYSLNFARSALAADYRSLGRYQEALDEQLQCLEDAERILGPADFNTLVARDSVAFSLRFLGRYQDAYEVDKQVLRQREEVLRERAPATLHSGNSCALDLRLLGRFREAAARQEQGMRLHLQVLGSDHPQTLWARHHLALCRFRAGLDRSETAGQLAGLLERRRQVHGRAHFEALIIANDYGNFLREHGDLGESRDLLTEAESGFRELLGPAHPVATGLQSNVGLLLQAEGARNEAVALFKQAYSGLAVLLGEEHPWTLGCALNAAGGHNIIGDLDEAAELSRNTLSRARRVLGDDHPLTLSAQIALAADLRALRQRTEAGKLEEDALERLTRTMGAQHPHTLSARQRIRPHWNFEAYLG